MIKVKSCAKINFFLDIKGVDEWGYHLIETVMASVSLGDIITVNKNGGRDINLTCKGVDKENNTAYIAAKKFKEKFGTCGFDIEISKNIPFCAGLGGSSADAAGVLFALSEIFNINRGSLKEICMQCGSDVFYMLYGGYAKASGRGEFFTPFDCKIDYDIVIAMPGGGVSTARAYSMFDKLSLNSLNCNADEVIDALKKGDFNALKMCCQNALYLPSKKILPQIEDVYQMLALRSAAAFMSGSGSACVGVFKDKESAENCAQYISSKSYWAVCASTQNKGIVIL